MQVSEKWIGAINGACAGDTPWLWGIASHVELTSESSYAAGPFLEDLILSAGFRGYCGTCRCMGVCCGFLSWFQGTPTGNPRFGGPFGRDYVGKYVPACAEHLNADELVQHFTTGLNTKVRFERGAQLASHVAMVQNQWYHFEIGAPLIVVYFSGDWDVHWGTGL